MQDLGKKRKGHPPRLDYWDYSSAGAYFVTFVVNERKCCLSSVCKDEITLSKWGQLVLKCWNELPTHFPNISLDEISVMPNHVHAIILLDGTCQGRALMNQGPTKEIFKLQRGFEPLMKNPSSVLGKVIRFWKAKTTREIHLTGFKSFRWQSRFYEHIIRNENKLFLIRRYIQNNPYLWHRDQLNPLKKLFKTGK